MKLFASHVSSRGVLRRRRQGGLLLEAILALGVATSLIGLSASYMASEKQRQEETMIASEQDILITASRAFLQRRYNETLTDLFDVASSTGSAIRTFSMADLVGAGFIPDSFNGGVLAGMDGQRYALLARAVDRADTATPQATMTLSDIDPGATGTIDPILTDGDFTNGEMEIEAVLVTYGGNPLPAATGGNVIGRMESAYGGYVQVAGKTRGPYANFEMDLTEFSGLPEYPSAGHFAGIVALSSYGVLGEGGAELIVDPLRRCANLAITSPEYDTCVASNEVYSDIVMRPYDSDGDTVADVFPALRNVTILDCAEGGAAGIEDEFRVDCTTTRLSGDFIAEGDNADIGAMSVRSDRIGFAGDDVVVRQTLGGVDENVLHGDRAILDGVNGGQDLSEAITDSKVVRATDTVAKPSCPAVAADGVTPMVPRIYVSPAAYADSNGRPTVGVRAFAEDSGANWTIRMMNFVAQDFCTNDASNPLPMGTPTFGNGAPDSPNCTSFDAAGAVVGPDRSDGAADVYEFSFEYAAAIVQTRCY